MGRYRERPRCRKIVEEFISKGGFSLLRITSGSGISKKGDWISFSDGLVKQAKKMLQEEESMCFPDGIDEFK